jgi:hypothetical protein
MIEELSSPAKELLAARSEPTLVSPSEFWTVFRLCLFFCLRFSAGSCHLRSLYRPAHTLATSPWTLATR